MACSKSSTLALTGCEMDLARLYKATLLSGSSLMISFVTGSASV